MRVTSSFWVKTAQAALLAAAVCFSTAASDVGARYTDLNHRLMCTCGCSQILGECNHVGCTASGQELKELKTALESGSSDKEVLAGFEAKYGATVLAAPTTHGFDLVAWIAPVAVFLAALLGTILLVRQWSIGKQAQGAAAGSAPEMDAIREKIRHETDGNGGY